MTAEQTLAATVRAAMSYAQLDNPWGGDSEAYRASILAARKALPDLVALVVSERERADRAMEALNFVRPYLASHSFDASTVDAINRALGR